MRPVVELVEQGEAGSTASQLGPGHGASPNKAKASPTEGSAEEEPEFSSKNPYWNRKKSPKAGAAACWKKVKNGDGDEYWWNTATNETSLEVSTAAGESFVVG